MKTMTSVSRFTGYEPYIQAAAAAYRSAAAGNETPWQKLPCEAREPWIDDVLPTADLIWDTATTSTDRTLNEATRERAAITLAEGDVEARWDDLDEESRNRWRAYVDGFGPDIWNAAQNARDAKNKPTVAEISAKLYRNLVHTKSQQDSEMDYHEALFHLAESEAGPSPLVHKALQKCADLEFNDPDRTGHQYRAEMQSNLRSLIVAMDEYLEDYDYDEDEDEGESEFLNAGDDVATRAELEALPPFTVFIRAGGGLHTERFIVGDSDAAASAGRISIIPPASLGEEWDTTRRLASGAASYTIISSPSYETVTV